MTGWAICPRITCSFFCNMRSVREQSFVSDLHFFLLEKRLRTKHNFMIWQIFLWMQVNFKENGDSYTFVQRKFICNSLKLDLSLTIGIR